ncbi:sporulation protein YunB [Domibacillus epiphyticus]|uniref:Sporulation protein YunB n=1 Tax=Domibacillus epiphyticus TaxID=1714355 RepID=A0A1V2A9Z3_9BACI|nr:sporulation protein YunB [Domibacillus epiphyticus]OMP67816.1 sporulation protein YunB [Domibacillus epiphyticus]
MRRRKKWRSKSKFSTRHRLLTAVFIFLAAILFILWLINRNIQPVLLNFADAQTNKIASMVLQKAISKEITENLDIQDIMITEQGEGTSTVFNAEVINKVLAEVTDLAEENLNQAEEGNLRELEDMLGVDIDTERSKQAEGISYTIPLGQITNNAILGNLGPRVPIRFHAIGDVTSNVKTKVEPFGINSAYVEVYIELEVNVQVIVPFAADTTVVRQTLPVAMGLVHGGVPEYYNPDSIGIPTK